MVSHSDNCEHGHRKKPTLGLKDVALRKSNHTIIMFVNKGIIDVPLDYNLLDVKGYRPAAPLNEMSSFY